MNESRIAKLAKLASEIKEIRGNVAMLLNEDREYLNNMPKIMREDDKYALSNTVEVLGIAEGYLLDDIDNLKGEQGLRINEKIRNG